MKFRTEYKVAAKKEEDPVLDPRQGVVLLGSCFADNIRQRMLQCRWDAVNPFGVLFNPLSIAKVVRMSLYPECDFLSDSIFESEGFYHSWFFDTKMSAGTASELKEKAAAAMHEFRNRIERGDTLIVTFGTAWCYFLKDGSDDYVVSNCHKQPQSIFERRRVSMERIIDTWTALLGDLTALNPDLRVILTVSPVRHLRDGFEGNMRSKATLLLAVEEICRRVGCCSYFPAYEIVNDDLRDYRFYASDLVHPSEMAVDYLWEIFQDTFLTDEGKSLLKEGEKEFKRANHRSILKN